MQLLIEKSEELTKLKFQCIQMQEEIRLIDVQNIIKGNSEWDKCSYKWHIHIFNTLEEIGQKINNIIKQADIATFNKIITITQNKPKVIIEISNTEKNRLSQLNITELEYEKSQVLISMDIVVMNLLLFTYDMIEYLNLKERYNYIIELLNIKNNTHQHNQ